MKRWAEKLSKKAKKLIADGKVERVTNEFFTVESSDTYTVFLSDDGVASCECKWSEYHDTRIDPCAHAIAVLMIAEIEDESRKLAFHADVETARRQHRPMMTFGHGLTATSRLI
jgi:hypothetical protein